MKKLVKFYLPAIIMASALFFTSCGDDETDPAPPTNNNCPDTIVFPTSTGNLQMNFLNFPGTDSLININAAANSTLTVSVQLVKGADNRRPQSLRVYQTGCERERGSIISFNGQPNAQDQGRRIDLRNTDDQIRTVFFNIPSGVNPLYINFEADLSGGVFVYQRLRINVSGSGIIDTHNNIILGGNTNANPSRMSASTGQTYTACNTPENISYVDITYGVSINSNAPATAVDQPFILSNPARNASLGLSTSGTCDGGAVSTGGGNATYFVKINGADFDAAGDVTINGINVTTSDPQFVQVAAGDVIGFLKSSGRKGMIRVDAINQGGSPASNNAGTIQIDVKVQR